MAVTIEDVQQILPFTADMDEDALQAHLDLAELIRTEQLNVSSCAMSTARKDRIVIYLTGHFAEASSIDEAGDPGKLKSSRMGEATDVYVVPPNDSGGAYGSTKWGQLALALDTCNILANSGRGLASFFEVITPNGA